MKINFYSFDRIVRTKELYVEEHEGYDVVTVLPEEIGRNVQYLEIDPEYFTAQVGDEGYMLSSGTITANTTLLYFTEREDFSFSQPANVMPIMGMRRNGDACFAIATGMSMAFYAHYTKQENSYKMTARFVIDGEAPYETLQMRFYKIANGTYNEMAHIYREWQVQHNGLKLIKERIENQPALRYAAESIELRIRMGWKPSPSSIPHQTPDHQPDMFVAMDFDRIIEVIDRMKQKGIKNVELCLVGWNIGGHDGCFPQLFPADERFGGNKKLKCVIDYAKKNGYTIVCHDNYTAAYECAECWDEEFVAKNKDGSLGSYDYPNLSGGIAYRLCPQYGYERFAKTRLPVMRDFGFYGLHFVDVFTARPANHCYDKAHPTGLKECRDYYSKIMNMSRELIGGFQSEGPFDFVAPALDYCMYTTMPYHKPNMVCDEKIPFWELVYHGYILSNPSAAAINYPIKGVDEELLMIERGGRPLMYYYSKFGKQRNWMGDVDLVCATEQEMEESIEAIRKAAEFADTYKSLQYETMEKHEKLAEGVFETTYSDGTVVHVDYNTKEYRVIWGAK